MNLQAFLVDKFKSWSPRAPEVVKRTKYSITLDWSQVEPFHFVADQLLYRLEKNDKIPPWFVVYRGGKTSKEIDNLAPRHPHKFRLRVIVKATAVPSLAERAILFYGDEAAVYEKMKLVNKQEEKERDKEESDKIVDGRDDKPNIVSADSNNDILRVSERGDEGQLESTETRVVQANNCRKWLESQWSEEAWASTDTDGTSVVCFCMAVRCGYIKQVQGMLDERPDLINLVNSSNGFTPLATAVRKGTIKIQTVLAGCGVRMRALDAIRRSNTNVPELEVTRYIQDKNRYQGDINMVRFLLCAGAEIDQRSANDQTALHIAVFTARIPIAQLLIEQGADFQARDINGCGVEHYAVDSGDIDTLRYILDKGGNLEAEDNNGWTPLFRALCQGAKTNIIEELVVRGSAVEVADRAGLPLTSAARLLANRQGRSRDSILRLVDSSYPHEKALANFTRLTKKIYNVHSLLKLPTLSNKKNL